jgi:hypothetical protein
VDKAAAYGPHGPHDESVVGALRTLVRVTTGPVPDDDGSTADGGAWPQGNSRPPAREQRSLDTALKAGGVLVVVGLLTTLVLLVEYFVGADLPGTWAYVVAMLAPLGFGLILLGLVVVAVRRRRATLTGESGPPPL